MGILAHDHILSNLVKLYFDLLTAETVVIQVPRINNKEECTHKEDPSVKLQKNWLNMSTVLPREEGVNTPKVTL